MLRNLLNWFRFFWPKPLELSRERLESLHKHNPHTEDPWQ